MAYIEQQAPHQYWSLGLSNCFSYRFYTAIDCPTNQATKSGARGKVHITPGPI